MSAPLKTHVFICTNSSKEISCGGKKSESLRASLKDYCKKPEWKGLVRINSAGCLGRCEEGIVAVAYPEGKWFSGLDATEQSLEILKQHVEESQRKT